MNYRIEDNGIAIERDRFHTGINGDFYTYPEIRAYADTLVKNFTQQENFAYFGGLEAPPWGSLGFAGQHRDSDALDRSNHEVIRDALMEIRPDAFTVESSSHWAVGWVEGIRVDTSDDVAVAAVMCWRDALEDYPIADEEHYYETEHEEDQEYYQCGGRNELVDMLRDYPELAYIFTNGDMLDGDVSPEYEDALNDVFHGAMAYGDRTAIPRDYVGEEVYRFDERSDTLRSEERARYEEVQPPLSE